MIDTLSFCRKISQNRKKFLSKEWGCRRFIPFVGKQVEIEKKIVDTLSVGNGRRYRAGEKKRKRCVGHIKRRREEKRRKEEEKGKGRKRKKEEKG